MHASQNESHSLYVPPNGELPHGGGTSRSSWQSTSCVSMLSSGARLQTIGWWQDTPWIIKRNEAIKITELSRERSVYSWSSSTTTPFTWHKTNHLYQLFAYAWGTRTVRKNAPVQHWHLCLDSLRHVGDSSAYPLTDLMFHLPRGLSGKRSSISIWTGRKSSRKKLTNDWQSDLSKMSSIWIGWQTWW